MKRFWGYAVLVSAALAMSACGDNACEKYEALVNNGGLSGKLKNCPNLKQQIDQLGWGVNINVDTCTKTIDDCSSSEQDSLESGLDCFDKLPTCASDADQNFVNSFNDCSSKWTQTGTGLSDKCRTALGKMH